MVTVFRSGSHWFGTHLILHFYTELQLKSFLKILIGVQYKKHSFSTSRRNQKRVLPNLWLHLAEPSQKIYRRVFASMELQTFTLTSCFFDSSVRVFRILP